MLQVLTPVVSVTVGMSTDTLRALHVQKCLSAFPWWLQMTSAKRSVSLGVMEDMLPAEAQSAGQVAAWRKSRRLPMLGPAPADICRARCCYL